MSKRKVKKAHDRWLFWTSFVVDEVIRPSEPYERTGIQKQVFNTIYQLTVLKREYPE